MMSQSKYTTDAPTLESETTWLDLREERTSDLISHLIDDNKALEQLKNALEDDLRSYPSSRGYELADAVN